MAPLAFIQEGGVGCKPKNMSAYEGQSAGAYNERCTNYILTGTSLGPHTSEIVVDAQQRVVLSGGLAGRSAVAVMIGKTLYVCWHDTATSDNTCTANLISVLDDRYQDRCDDIIIGGDFNTDPSNIKKILSPAKRKRHGFEHRRVLNSNCDTHYGKKNEELDYFIHLRKKSFPKTEPKVVSYDVAPSDHDPVCVKWP